MRTIRFNWRYFCTTFPVQFSAIKAILYQSQPHESYNNSMIGIFCSIYDVFRLTWDSKQLLVRCHSLWQRAQALLLLEIFALSGRDLLFLHSLSRWCHPSSDHVLWYIYQTCLLYTGMSKNVLNAFHKPNGRCGISVEFCRNFLPRADF